MSTFTDTVEQITGELDEVSDALARLSRTVAVLQGRMDTLTALHRQSRTRRRLAVVRPAGALCEPSEENAELAEQIEEFLDGNLPGALSHATVLTAEENQPDET